MKTLRLLVGLLLPFWAMTSAAHTPLLSCFENNNDTVTCEGGFSNGASAAGVAVRLIDEIDRVLIEGSFGQDSTFTFAKPSVEYHVVLDAGNNHVVIVYGGEID